VVAGCSHPEVSKTVQLGEPLRSNWPVYSALHVTVWGVCGQPRYRGVDPIAAAVRPGLGSEFIAPNKDAPPTGNRVVVDERLGGLLRSYRQRPNGKVPATDWLALRIELPVRELGRNRHRLIGHRRRQPNREVAALDQ
jgi:hypothetical protein